MRDLLAGTLVLALYSWLGWSLVLEPRAGKKVDPRAATAPRAALRDTCFTDRDAYGDPWVCFDAQGKLVSLACAG